MKHGHVQHPTRRRHAGDAPQDQELLGDRQAGHQRGAGRGCARVDAGTVQAEQRPGRRRWKTSIRAAQEGGKTLIQSAQLRNSIHAKSDASGFAVGTNVKYAATHQFGEPSRTIRARKKKALRFQVGGKWVTKKQVRITIPARPFLGLSEDDMQEMKATVEEFIQKED